MHPSTRTAVLRFLATHDEPSQEEVAAGMRVDVRTARRHLRELEADGAILARRDGSRKRYRLDRRAEPLPPLTFEPTEAQAEALFLAAMAAAPLLRPTPFAEPLATAADALRQSWTVDAFVFDADAEHEAWTFEGAAPGEQAAFDRALFLALVDAVRGHHPIRADYTSKKGRRVRPLHPLGFFVAHGSWSLAAHDPEAAAGGKALTEKDFSLTAFHAVEVLEDATFAPPSGFDLRQFVRRFGPLQGSAPVEVRLRVRPDTVEAFRRKAYGDHQQVGDGGTDGWTEVTFRADPGQSLTSWCLSWGAKIEVAAPATLRETVAAAHEEASARYAR